MLVLSWSAVSVPEIELTSGQRNPSGGDAVHEARTTDMKGIKLCSRLRAGNRLRDAWHAFFGGNTDKAPESVITGMRDVNGIQEFAADDKLRQWWRLITGLCAVR